MHARHPIPARICRVEETIRRSRFIATAGHAPDTDAARAFVARVKEEFPDAAHNCWAFVAGPPGSTARMGQSDDGEPHGTAGRPMLNALLHSGVGEIAVVVTRYFGGVKLGTGGLVRAYGDMARLALESLPLREKVERIRLDALLAYEHVDGFRRLLPVFEAEVVSEEFAADAAFALRLPREHEAGLRRAVADLTGGLALLEPGQD
ncbi:YigZ family protein [Paucidesulfovibrio longus]|uniref:YigZ family protein n=1 Tax=Paucidesulfovibrio longus TaxID=889 RepID=UPI0003B4ACE9|nr:YigZ family protein [Paucidesulfovibrio longus]